MCMVVALAMLLQRHEEVWMRMLFQISVTIFTYI